MPGIKNKVRGFLLAPQSSIWLAALRIGLGLEIFLYAVSLRGDWLEIFGESHGLIRRDLTEAILSADSPFIPRVGWIVDAGAHIGLSETAVLWSIWIILVVAALFVAVGLFCREASVVAWLLYVCTAKSAEVLSYGVDNFTIIGLFYLAIAPQPDAWSLDSRWRGVQLRDASLHGLHRRVLQLHMCIIYFFGGIAKCVGRGWWNGTSLWRAMTRAPFDVVPPEILIRVAFLLPMLGILICLTEATYPILIWPQKTRVPCFVGILGMHVGIALVMGMYLFAGIMIVLNMAAFGPGHAFYRRRPANDLTLNVAQPIEDS